MTTQPENLTWDSPRDFRRDRPGDEALERDLGWWVEDDPEWVGYRWRITYRPDARDVYAISYAPATRGEGHVELLADGVEDLDVVLRALWLDDVGDDEASLFVRRETGEEAFTIGWARGRLRIGDGGTSIPAPSSSSSRPPLVSGEGER